MKRYIKHFGFFVCIFLLLFSLTSCFTNTQSKYTEWAFSDDLSVLTNGETEYKLYKYYLSAEWIQTYNNTFYYGSTVQFDDTYARITRPVDNDTILYVSFYEKYGDSYSYTAFYTTHTGASALQYMTSPTVYGNSYLYDPKTNEGAPLTDTLKDAIGGLTPMEDTMVSVSIRALNDYDKIEVVSYGLDGFVKHVHGVFYFNKGQVYYLDTKNSENHSYDEYGYLNGDYWCSVYEIDNATCEMVYEKCENLTQYAENVDYEEPVLEIVSDGANLQVAKIVLSLFVIFFGIVIPAVPLTFALVSAFKKKWNIDAADYVLLSASAVWIISGIVILTLVLL